MMAESLTERLSKCIVARVHRAKDPHESVDAAEFVQAGKSEHGYRLDGSRLTLPVPGSPGKTDFPTSNECTQTQKYDHWNWTK